MKISTQRLVVLTMVGALAATTGCGAGETADAVQASATTWPGCKAFKTQPDAQQAWEKDGRPAVADRDDDGKVCESLPSTGGGAGSTSTPASTSDDDGTALRPGDGSGCRLTKGVAKIGVSKTKYPAAVKHVSDAIAKGWPRVWVINRVGAGARRDRLLRGVKTAPGMDRDEVPMSAARGRGKDLQRGSNPRGWKADVRLIPSAQNRGAGSVIGAKMRQYCDGQRIEVIGY